jgi:hypothetical protein
MLQDGREEPHATDDGWLRPWRGHTGLPISPRRPPIALLVPIVILWALPLAVIVVTNAIVLHEIEAGEDVRTAAAGGPLR